MPPSSSPLSPAGHESRPSSHDITDAGPHPGAIAARPASTTALLLMLCGAFVVLLLRTAWVCDDAFITLRTVDNAVAGYGLRWNVDERVQAFTHPLWMLSLTAVYAVTREPYFTTIALSIAVALAGVLVLAFRVGAGRPAAVLAVLGLCSSRAFVEFSTSGLENPLTHLLLAVFALLLIRGRRSARWLLWLTLCAALLVLTRQDAVLLILPASLLAAGIVWRSEGIRGWRWVPVGLVPLVAWEVFSLVYYGFLFPNTAYAKLSTGVPRGEAVEQGIRYLTDFADTDPAGFVLVGLGLAVGACTRGLRLRALAVGIALSLVYVVMVGGDFMSGRFCTPAIMASACILVAAPWPRLRGWWAVPATALVTLALVPSTSVFRTDATLGGDGSPSRAIRPTGITDERRFYFPFTGLARQRPGHSVSQHYWIDEARRARDASPDKKTFVYPAIGFVGFYLGPATHVIDAYGLSDPLLARLPASPRWRVGHYPRRVPDGYEATVRSGENRLTDPVAAEVYDHLARITRGPLWTAERWGSIVGFLTGRIPARLDAYALERRQAAEISTPFAPGLPWDAAGAVVLPEHGLEVTFPAPTKARALELSVSGNDRYTIALQHGDARVFATTLLPPLRSDVRDGSPLAWRYVILPRGTQAFDRVRVVGRRGDFRYSVGHLRPLP